MRSTDFKTAAALLFCLFFGSACRAPVTDTLQPGGLTEREPAEAGKIFFNGHSDFYCKDPVLCKRLLTERFFRILKHEYDSCAVTGQMGALDCDPWTNAQEGHVSEPFSFQTIENKNSEAIVRFNYTFTLGPKSSLNQSVFLKFQRASLNERWKLADFIMPNHESLVELLERKP